MKSTSDKADTDHLFVYRVHELPDPDRPAHQAVAGGDVSRAVWQDCLHLLRIAADMAPGSVSLTIRFCFTPGEGRIHPQKRLALFLCARASDSDIGRCLPTLITQGPLARFFTFSRVCSSDAAVPVSGAACHIFRRDRLVRPLVSQEFNDEVPSNYYCCQPFLARENNDYALVDSVLDGIGEPLAIDIAVEPSDNSAELAAFARYKTRLQEINRTWGRDDDRCDAADLLRDEPAGRYGHSRIEPFHRKDSMAASILREMERMDATLNARQFRYHIVVATGTRAVAQLAGSVVAECAFDDGGYQLVVHQDEALLLRLRQCLAAFCVIDSQEYGILTSAPNEGEFTDLARVLHLASPDELKGIWRLPVASINSPRCIRADTDPPEIAEENMIVLGHDATARGSHGRNAIDVPRGIPRDVLVKHWMVTGMPGGGKTTSAHNFLFQLLEMGIPWLVLETAKTEYRGLVGQKMSDRGNPLSAGASVELYSPGNDHFSPFRHNPLGVFSGIQPEAHTDALLNCFKAAMPLGGPLPAILAEAVDQVYDSHPDPAEPPVLADLVDAVEQVLARKGYSGETNSNIRAAAEVRFGLLTRGPIGRVFQCRESVPHIGHLLSTPTIVEMDSLAPDQACLLTLFILTAIDEALRAAPLIGGLRLVILLEEAHNVLGTSHNAVASEDNPDPKAFASDYFCRMLAEFRARGVAVVILDQSPSAIAAEVVKNTASKLAFRQVAEDDRKELGAAMLFGRTEFEEIARLRPGEAYFSTEGYYGPRRIRAINIREGVELSSPSPAGPFSTLRKEPWFADATRIRVDAELAQLRIAMDAFDIERLQIVNGVVGLLSDLPHTLSENESENRLVDLAGLARRASSMKDRLAEIYRAFCQGPYRHLLASAESVVSDDGLCRIRENLVARFESVIEPDVKQCAGMLVSLIARCRATKRRRVSGV